VRKFYTPHDAAKLFFFADEFGARSRALAADIEPIGAIGDHLLRPFQKGRIPGVAAAAIKGIGGPVNDPHDKRAVNSQ
jgi:hypothetical protein